jgi:hypothetical protein
LVVPVVDLEAELADSQVERRSGLPEVRSEVGQLEVPVAVELLVQVPELAGCFLVLVGSLGLDFHDLVVVVVRRLDCEPDVGQ